MKKTIAGAIMLFFTTAGFAQEKMEPVKIDSLVTVSLPAEYTKSDTLNQQMFSAKGDFGYMVVVKASEDNQPLEKEKDLNKVMDKYVKNFRNQYTDASAQNVRDTTMGKLKAKTFTLQYRADDSSIQFKNFVLLYTTPASYIFEYAYPGMRQEVVRNELKTFVSSIKLSPDLTRTDQYTSTETGMSPVVRTGLIAGGSLLVIGLIVVMINKRRNALA
jgi:hypothetical protein